MISKTKFGIYGRKFVSETLIPAIEELATEDSDTDNGNSVMMGFEA